MNERNICRCCGGSNIKLVENGYMAPFFLYRVYGIRQGTIFNLPRLIGIPLCRRLNLLATGTGNIMLKKILMNLSPYNSVKIKYCMDCTFAGPGFDLPEAGLAQHYQNYMSGDYWKERESFETWIRMAPVHPAYHEGEIAGRLKNVDNFLTDNLSPDSISSVLDWGGGKGEFIPSIFSRKKITVYEPFSNSGAVNNPKELGMYDYVQICHVLEHVPAPQQMIAEIKPHMSPNGYLYIELPCGMGERDIMDMAAGKSNNSILIGEHINSFNETAVKNLVQSAGLKLVSFRSADVDLGWTRMKILSVLAKK